MKYGDFTVSVGKDEIEVDEYGNVWLSDQDIEKTLKIIGGADMDDSVGIISIEGKKAVLYRNPNQYGEYLIKTLRSFNEVKENILVGSIPQKNVSSTVADIHTDKTDNKLYNSICSKKVSLLSLPIFFVDYNSKNLIRTYSINLQE